MVEVKEFINKSQLDFVSIARGEEEITEQTKNGYNEKYTGYGCHINVIKAFCNTTCPMNMKNPR